jgi:thiol-disulfide isomerase/thioredoxin
MQSSEKSAPSTSWALKAALGLVAVGVLALLYVLFAASSKPEGTGNASFAKGDMARLVVLDEPPPRPDIVLKDAAGAETTLAAFEGEVILVNLWATWCAPCMEEMPTLGALQRQFEGRGFRVVPISADSAGDAPRAQSVLAELSGGSLDFLIDPSRAILFAEQARGMPTTVLYDRQGREIARVTGGADWSGPDAVALIEHALAER